MPREGRLNNCHNHIRYVFWYADLQRELYAQCAEGKRDALQGGVRERVLQGQDAGQAAPAGVRPARRGDEGVGTRTLAAAQDAGGVGEERRGGVGVAGVHGWVQEIGRHCRGYL